MFNLCFDEKRNPLGLLSPKESRLALNCNDAAVYKRYPFTLIFKNNLESYDFISDLDVKIDFGYKHSGLTLSKNINGIVHVYWASQIKHRHSLIVESMSSRASLRRSRRGRKTRYRKARWLNRVRDEDWFPPSVTSNIAKTLAMNHIVLRSVAQKLIIKSILQNCKKRNLLECFIHIQLEKQSPVKTT